VTKEQESVVSAGAVQKLVRAFESLARLAPSSCLSKRPGSQPTPWLSKTRLRFGAYGHMRLWLRSNYFCHPFCWGRAGPL
jgi:hypothetical protein